MSANRMDAACNGVEATGGSDIPADRPGSPGDKARERLLCAYGDFPLAFSVAAGSTISSFGSPDGFIGYGQNLGQTFALGDPVCAPGRRRALIASFIKAFGSPHFVCASRDVSAILGESGYRATQFGVDTRIAIGGEAAGRRQGRQFCRASARLKARGYRLGEIESGAPTTAEIVAMSERWFATRIVRQEMKFINRGLYLADPEIGVRRFFLFDPDDRLIAFVGFDPIWRDGEVIGYMANHRRRDPEAPSWAELGVMHDAIERFRAEGREILSLGLSPLVTTPAARPGENRMLRAIFAACYRSRLVNRYGYNVQGHVDYKRKFDGDEVPLYFASRARIGVVAMIALARMCGLGRFRPRPIAQVC